MIKLKSILNNLLNAHKSLKMLYLLNYKNSLKKLGSVLFGSLKEPVPGGRIENVQVFCHY